MRNILVIAYQLHWQKGSEYAVAWDYVTHMSMDNRLTVLYGTCCGYHTIGNTEEMENYAKQNPLKNVTFIPVKPSFKSKDYGFSLLGQYMFYREYKKWHQDVLRTSTQLIQGQHFDIIHYLGPIGYREPGFLFHLPIPYIWGPMCGLTGAPISLFKATGSLMGGVKLYAKKLLDYIQRISSIRVRRAVRCSDVVVCATTEWAAVVRKIAGRNHHSKILYRPENCISVCNPLNTKKFENKQLNLIFIGRLDSGKAFISVLDALRKIPKDAPFRLNVLGTGSLKEKYVKYTRQHNIDHFVNWEGQLPRQEVYKKLNESHLMVMPSLIDANTTVVWEAMAMGVPTMALDHCGFHDTIVHGKTGILIKPDGYTQTVNTIARELNELITHPEKLKSLADGVVEDRVKHTWDERKKFFEETYRIAEEQFEKRNA